MKKNLKNKGKYLNYETFGFTLIELLAVIVILAIIALIATPIILGIVEDARRDAFLRSVELVVSTTDIDIFNKTYTDSYTYEIRDGNISNLEIGVKNTGGMNGSITYDLKGNEEYAIHNNKYCVIKKGKNKAEISDYEEGMCSLIPINYTSEKCFVFEGNTITDYYEYEENNENNPLCPKDVMIPSKINKKTVTTIGEYAFYDKDLTSVEFPRTVEVIEAFAFKGNNFTNELDLTNSNIKVIKESAFEGNCYFDEYGNGLRCNSTINTLKLPSTLEQIEEGAFSYLGISGELDLSNTKLENINGFDNNFITKIKFPSNVKTIGDYAFYTNRIEGILDLSDTKITSIGNGAFSVKSLEGGYYVKFNKIENIKLPSTINNIGSYAFAYNVITGELDLSMCLNLTNIGSSAFRNNELTSVKLPANITGIFNGAFEKNRFTGELDLSMYTNLTTVSGFGWNAITSIKLPSNIEKIEGDAFSGTEIVTDGILDLSMYTNLKSVSGFDNNEITGIKLPSNIENIDVGAFSYNDFSGELDLSMYSNLTIVNGFNSNEISSLKLPSNVESIGYSAFASNKFEDELDLSMYESLTSIENFAFEGAQNGGTNRITSVKFPESIENIGSWTFGYNKLSGELDLSMYPNLKSIGSSAFIGSSYGVTTNQITSVKFPNSIESIAYGAFLYNKLESVTFYGRSDLTGIEIEDNVWGWASGYSESNSIHFENLE